MRTLVLSWDRLGGSMAGSAIRSLELARAVARAGVDVTIAAPEGSVLPAGTGIDLVSLEEDQPPRDVVAAQDSVVLPGRMELMTALHKPIAVDLYDPFVLSNLDFFGEGFDRGGARALLALRWLEHHLRYGDFFLCASEVQRRFWLGMLTSAGRLNRANYENDPELRRLLAVLPFGLPDQRPVPGPSVLRGRVEGIGADDRIVLWAGGLWNWVDPLTLVRAVANLRETRPEVKAVLLGARHPNPQIGEMEVAVEARELAAQLDPSGEGFVFLDWVPYEDRHRYLLEADVGVSLHRPGVESEFAFRTRVLDYIWTGLPMVLTDGDDLARRTAAEGVSRLVPPGDERAVAEAILALLDEQPAGAHAAEFARLHDEFCWDKIAEPLVEFCREPRCAADAPESSGASASPWMAGISREDAPQKEAALVADEFVGNARTLSPALGQGHICSQTFRGAFDGLSRIDIFLSVDGAPEDSEILFELHHEARVIARVRAPVAEVERDGWQAFEFRPIPASRGRDFEIRVSVPQESRTPTGPRVHLQHTAYREGVGGQGCRPAFIARYLLAGVDSELSGDPDNFVFRHNTTLPVLPGGPGEAALPPATTLDAGALSVELAETRERLAAAERHGSGLQERIGELERRLPDIAQNRAHIEVRYRGLLFPLWYEVLRVVRLAGQALRWSIRTLATLLVLSLGLPLAVVVFVGLAVVDLLPTRSREEEVAGGSVTPGSPVSIVIPTWNGRGLLEMSLPPLVRAVRAHGHPDDEILVVDNGSEDDSVAWLEEQAAAIPFLRVIPLSTNEGFAGATNRGAREARNPALILLNNDMVVEEDFIQPLLDPFAEEPELFGVSCQIDFIDPEKPRWETGKVHGEFRGGRLHLFHLDRFEEDLTWPIFFAGGGASAYDRSRFLALGGFDEAVFSPVYIEDVDLGYRAWRRGWPSVLAPRSLVHHKHRGTTRRRWSEAQIHSFFVKNLAALVWKNVSSWRLLLPHLASLAVLPARVMGEVGSAAAFATLRGLWRQVPAVLAARRRERMVDRPLDDAAVLDVSRWRSAYRARFHPRQRHEGRPQVMVLSPYSPVPALHGGAVRISNLLRAVSEHVDITLLSLADTEAETDPASLAELGTICREAIVVQRDRSSASGGWLAPGKLRGFFSSRLEEEIRERMERCEFAVVQAEYTHMAHFLPPPRAGLLRVLVEHDVSFVALERARRLPGSWQRRIGLLLDGLRTFRHEIRSVAAADRTLTMSETDRDVLANYVDPSRLHVVPNGVDCRAFPFADSGHDENTILFVGFFRHEPNVEAALWFAREILPRVQAERPEVRFRVVGAYPPPPITDLAQENPAVEVVGRVPETASEYRRAGVFVAPVRRGSGTRLKILEAMASGAAVVSTTIGAEGIEAPQGAIAIGDDPESFAAAVVDTLADAEARTGRIRAARTYVEANFDWPAVARRLLDAWGIEERQRSKGAGG